MAAGEGKRHRVTRRPGPACRQRGRLATLTPWPGPWTWRRASALPGSLGFLQRCRCAASQPVTAISSLSRGLTHCQRDWLLERPGAHTCEQHPPPADTHTHPGEGQGGLGWLGPWAEEATWEQSAVTGVWEGTRLGRESLSRSGRAFQGLGRAKVRKGGRDP